MENFFEIFYFTIISSIPIWFILRQIKTTYLWDYGISFYAVSIWALLGDYYNVGGQQSLSNAFIEPTYIQLFSIFITSVRFFIYKFTKITFYKTSSIICILLTICFAVLIRIYMPELSE